MEYINTRTLARLAAVQGLYQYAIDKLYSKAVIISRNYYSLTIKIPNIVKKDFNPCTVPIITKLNTF